MFVSLLSLAIAAPVIEATPIDRLRASTITDAPSATAIGALVVGGQPGEIRCGAPASSCSVVVGKRVMTTRVTYTNGKMLLDAGDGVSVSLKLDPAVYQDFVSLHIGQAG